MPQRQLVPSRRSLLTGLPSVAAFTALVTAVAVAPGQLPQVEQEVITSTGGSVETNMESVAIPAVQRASNEPGSDPSTTPDAKEPAERSTAAANSATADDSPSPSSSPSPSQSSSPDAPTSEAAQPKASSGKSSKAPTPSKKSASEEHTDHADDNGQPSHAPASKKGGPAVVAALKPDATADYQMLGVTWRDPDAEVDFTVEIRTRGDSGWSDWTELHHTGDSENVDEPGARGGTAPMWVGDSNGVAVRVLGHDAPPADLSLELIDTGEGNSQNTSAELMASTAMPNIIRRRTWNGGTEPSNSCSDRYGDTVRAVTVHHTVNPNGYSRSESDNLMRGIHRYHTQANNWCDIGYNFLIDRYGRIYEGRGGGISRPVRGAHAGDWAVNEESTGVSLIGRFDTGRPTAAMKRALIDFTAWRLSSFNRDPKGTAWIGGRRFPVIMGHRDVKSTACPGGHVYDWLPQMRNAVKSAMSAPSGPSPIEQKYQSMGGAGGVLGKAVTSERNAWGGRYQEYSNGAILDSGRTRPQAVSGAIDNEYERVGRAGSALGFPTSDERSAGVPGGRMNKFQHGDIYWSSPTDAHWTIGAITNAYHKLGGAAAIGLPISNELSAGVPGGRMSKFQRGDVFWSSGTGAHGVSGAIRNAYHRAGGAVAIGLPTANERSAGAANGRVSTFERADIYWSGKLGAHSVYGAIRNTYDDLGGAPAIGLPTANERSAGVPGGRVSAFQRGDIYWSSRTKAHGVYGAIRRTFDRLGGTSAFGLPTTSELPAGVPGGRMNKFQHGDVFWSSRTGAHGVGGAIRGAYHRVGGARAIGLPVTNERDTGVSGGRMNRFQRGDIYWSSKTGAHSVYGAIRGAYRRAGGPAELGLPTSREKAYRNGRMQTFEKGTIRWNSSTRRITITR